MQLSASTVNHIPPTSANGRLIRISKASSARRNARIQQDEDDHHRHRHHQLRSFLLACLAKSSNCPRMTRWYPVSVSLSDRSPTTTHRHHIPCRARHVNPAGWTGIFGFQHGWSGNDLSRQISPSVICCFISQIGILSTPADYMVILRIANVNRYRATPSTVSPP